MFERTHHLRVAVVLGALDANTLATNACFFGGGTAIVLRYGEYRESVDIDFLVSNLEGYRNLRGMMMGPHGLQSIVRPGMTLTQSRELRADQYGIRTMLVVGDTLIKFEITFEGRIELQRPSKEDCVCGVTTLTSLDMVASKLLANSDRWADDAALSRDIIDLAMMTPSKRMLKQAIDKASRAYSDVEMSLVNAVDGLRNRPGHLEHCMQELRMTVPKALLWERIKAIAPRKPMS